MIRDKREGHGRNKTNVRKGDRGKAVLILVHVMHRDVTRNWES